MSTRLATVEQQLTSFFSSIAAQANASRLAAESARHDARADLEALAISVRDAIERLTNQSIDDRKALRHALDARLADLGSHQDWRFAELEARLERVVDEAAALPTVVPPGMPGAPMPPVGAPGISAHDVDKRLTEILGPVAARVEALGSELGHVSLEIKRLDANGAALHRLSTELQGAIESRPAVDVDAQLAELRQQIGVSLTSLKGDMDAQTAATRTGVEHALTALRTQVLAEAGQQIAAQVSTQVQAAVEGPVNDRLHDLDGQIAALRGGIDQTLAALSGRMTEIEADKAATHDRLVKVEHATAKVDPTEIDHLREKVQTAVGEAVLMRIEMDRLSGSLDERFDSVRVRLSEVEAQVADNMDVSTAVQLERLEELERAVLFLTPTDTPSALALASSQAHRAAAPEKPAAVTAPSASPVATASPVPPPPGAPARPAATGQAPVPPPPGASTSPVPPAPPTATAVPPPPATSVTPPPPPSVTPAATAAVVPPPPPAAHAPQLVTAH